MNKRIFAFGCSHTQYPWPTWADLIGHSAKQEGFKYYNYGQSGYGNFAIYASMIHADLIHTFTPDDIIMVLWSGWNREDRFHNNVWTNVGNVFNNSHFNDEFIKQHWSSSNDCITTVSAIYSATKIFNPVFSASGFPGGYETPRVDYAETPNIGPNDFSDEYIVRCSDVLSRIDGHWNTLSHIKYVEQVVSAIVGITLSKETIKWGEDFNAMVEQEIPKIALFTENEQRLHEYLMMRRGWAALKSGILGDKDIWNPESAAVFLKYFNNNLI